MPATSRVIFVSAALLALALAAACGERTPQPGPGESATAPARTGTAPPTPTPTPFPTLDVALRLSSQAHQGLPHALRVEVRRQAFPVTANIVIDFGDGTVREVAVGGEGVAEVEHVYLEPGRRTIVAEARAASSMPGRATASITVHPRVVVFVQGMNSASACPDGRGFATRAPQWLGPYLFEPVNLAGLRLDRASFAYFSYSGRWCASGEAGPGLPADYRPSDTCAGIAGRHAPRLKEFIDALAPAKVTIVAHSLGGLVAAYLVATEEDWARERVVSVATFDSPLRGVNGLRVGLLGAGGVFDADCSLNSDAVRDLWDTSGVVGAARTAAAAVPFYTSDATRGEGASFGQVEAVPGRQARLEGEVAHARFAERHGETWSQAGDDVEAKRRFVACAILLAPASCLDAGD
jgi:pimeloyl-ACP methyl ester carboxylesterase